MPRLPVEPKASAGGLGGTAAGVLIWVLQTYVLKGRLDPGLQAYIYAAVPGAIAFAAAWLAPHQARPGDAPVPPPVIPPSGAVTVTPPGTQP
jgi:hypothetical protein